MFANDEIGNMARWGNSSGTSCGISSKLDLLVNGKLMLIGYILAPVHMMTHVSGGGETSRNEEIGLDTNRNN